MRDEGRKEWRERRMKRGREEVRYGWSERDEEVERAGGREGVREG